MQETAAYHREMAVLAQVVVVVVVWEEMAGLGRAVVLVWEVLAEAEAVVELELDDIRN